MATVTLCDCCGGETDQPIEIGKAHVGEFCGTCAVEVQTLYDELDGVHERLVALFVEERSALVSAFFDAHPEAKIGDLTP